MHPPNMKACQSFASFVFTLCISLLLILTWQDFTNMIVGTTIHNVHDGNETDRLSLLSIKDQIQDPMQVLSSWNTSLHFCQWSGVSCGRRHPRVTMLNLRSQSLSGYLSPSIGNLSFLRSIDVSNNSFNGEIPHEIDRLFRLRELVLTNNSFEGYIPANLSSCLNLSFLDLRGNHFTGQVPFELGSLTKLVKLSARNNYLTGSIPSSLGNLSALISLDLSSNELEGLIPESLAQLKSLAILSLAGNRLSGNITPSIFNLSSLTSLALQRNQIQGNLPNNIGLTIPRIETLLLSNNNFTGIVPFSLSNASNLQKISIGMNNLFWGMPIFFGNMKNLSWLNMVGLGSFGQANDLGFISSLINCSRLRILILDASNFGGTLPNSVANLSTELQFFTISENQISGNIPSGLGNLVGLNSLDMHYNQFVGSIPETIGKLHKLQEVGFGKNKLSGKIPFSIGNLTLLTQLWLEQNKLEGSIPSTLGNCQNLFLLHLYSNALNGTIPPEVIGLKSLTKSLNLSRNHLTGSLPAEVGNLKNLVELDISKNKLSGEIPSSLGACTILERLYMDDNSFKGIIPNSLSALRGIEELDLSHNNLSGNLLKEFGSFVFFRKLNLSFNDFEGEVPIGGVFSNASEIDLAGNRKLCGGVPELGLPMCPTKKLRKTKMSFSVKLIISIVGGFLGLALIIAFLIIWRKKEIKQPASASLLRDPFMNVSYGALLKATDGFSAGNFIGSGSFGSVYKGILEPDQTDVAVKVLNLQRRGACKSFMAECEALRNIRHRNLVKVITACSSVDYKGDEFKALVYEFMPNGSLETWLHPLPQTCSNVHENPKILSLSRRLAIVIDVAVALDYLHNHCRRTIIHCDLKPSNILLDCNMTARLGDFGLAKIIPQCNVEISPNQTSSSGIKGTIGYAPPEYGMGSMATTQGDVYGFGILLLEMFTGKKPTDDIFKDGSNLHKLVKMALPERVMGIVDHVLLLGIGGKEAAVACSSNNQRRERTTHNVCDFFTSILKIGVACAEESPRERMSVCDVVKELEKIKKSVP